jgi:hypothetical protein
MKRPMIIVILVLLMLSGCASTGIVKDGYWAWGHQWCKEGATESDFERDSIDCQRKATAESGSSTVSQMVDYRMKCISERGWGDCLK